MYIKSQVGRVGDKKSSTMSLNIMFFDSFPKTIGYSNVQLKGLLLAKMLQKFLVRKMKMLM